MAEYAVQVEEDGFYGWDRQNHIIFWLRKVSLSRRREKSTLIIKNIFEYLDELWLNQMVDRRSPLGKAIFYTRERKKSLSEFLDHPDIPISNNEVERAIRPVAIGRKNWLFCWSEVGAKYAAMAFTLIESCPLL